MKKFLAATGLASALALAATSAEAALALQYNLDGGGSVVVNDGGVGDADGVANGVVTALVGGGSITLSVLGGSQGNLQLNMNVSSLLTSGAAGTLEVLVSGTGFTAPAAGTYDVSAELGISALIGTMDYQAWIDDSNALFGQAVSVIDQSGANAADDVNDDFENSVSTALDGTFSMTQRFNFTIPANQGSESIQAQGTVQVNVPEPATLALFGAGLLGLGMIRRRKA